MATHCRRTEIQEVSDSNGRPLISSTTQPARPGNRRFCVLGPYAEGVGPGPGLLIGRLWRGSSLSTGPFPTTPFQTVLRFPAHGLTMIFVMWRAWRQRTDRTWPFDGSSLRLYEPSPESSADDPTWRTSIAGPGSCRAFTERWLAVSGMPSRLPPRRLDTKAGSLPSSVFCCTPSQVLRTPRTPSRLGATSAVRPYTLGLCPTRLPGRVSPVPHCSFPTCHRLRPRRGPASLPVQNAVCCLRLDMTGSALSNAFRLIIWRGCSVHLLLRPAGLLPSLSRASDTPLGSGGSLRSAGVCYRALRRLPGRDFRPREQRVFQDAPSPHSTAMRPRFAVRASMTSASLPATKSAASTSSR